MITVKWNGFKNKTDRQLGMWLIVTNKHGSGFYFITDPTAVNSLSTIYRGIRIVIKNKLFIGWIK